MIGKLYVVATPIGNLEDVSQRAVAILNEVDFICAEDTRVTVKLLNRCAIKKPLVSYYEHNKEHKGREILERIVSGEQAAIVTDAGMPCISDPGQLLVRMCKQAGVEVVGIPGPSAVVTAVAVSGILNNRFAFEGFLSDNKTRRIAHLQEVKHLPHSLVFYCSPHKLRKTLEDIYSVLGDREIALCRELTKKFEETELTSVAQSIQLYKEKLPRGEYVLVVAGEGERSEVGTPSLQEAVTLAKAYIEQGSSTNGASKLAAVETGLSKREIYNLLLQEKK